MLSKNLNRDYSFIFSTCPIFSKKFSILGKLGEGHSANVFKVEDSCLKNKFAVKAFNHKNFKSKIVI